MNRNIAALLAVAMLAGCTVPANGDSRAAQCVPGTSRGESPAGLKQVTLCVTSKNKTHSFTVEVAGGLMSQAKGLMFRTSLADDAGMIFPFAFPRQASFWMKNTVIPLDIIFVKTDGTIESIAQNTVPYSTDAVKSVGTVGAVLEVRGGLTSELGINAGDRVVWRGK